MLCMKDIFKACVCSFCTNIYEHDSIAEEDFIAYTKNKPIEYQMYLEFPNKGDAVDDTTALWTGDHKTLLVGTLKVEKYDGEACNQDVYFPSELPSGVEAPIDPLFDLRTPTYAITFGKRQ